MLQTILDKLISRWQSRHPRRWSRPAPLLPPPANGPFYKGKTLNGEWGFGKVRKIEATYIQRELIPENKKSWFKPLYRVHTVFMFDDGSKAISKEGFILIEFRKLSLTFALLWLVAIMSCAYFVPKLLVCCFKWLFCL